MVAQLCSNAYVREQRASRRNYHYLRWHYFSVVCKGGTQPRFASVSFFSYQVVLWLKGKVYVGSVREAVCSQLQVLYEAVYKPTVIIQQLQL